MKKYDKHFQYNICNSLPCLSQNLSTKSILRKTGQTATDIILKMLMLILHLSAPDTSSGLIRILPDDLTERTIIAAL